MHRLSDAMQFEAASTTTAKLGNCAFMLESNALCGLSDDFIFPGKNGNALSCMTLLALLQRRMKRPTTVHGLRSSFRDWCWDEGDVPRDLAEASLAHVIKDATERAYRRKTAVERRRKVMQQWCDYILPPAPTEIINIEEVRRGRATAA